MNNSQQKQRNKSSHVQSLGSAGKTKALQPLFLQARGLSRRDVLVALAGLGYDVAASNEPEHHTSQMWGRRARAALRQFQDEHGLECDGRLSAETLDLLLDTHADAMDTQAPGDSHDDASPLFFEEVHGDGCISGESLEAGMHIEDLSDDLQLSFQPRGAHMTPDEEQDFVAYMERVEASE